MAIGTEVHGYLVPVGSTGWSVLSGQQMQELSAAMREINENSSQIGKIIKTIEGAVRSVDKGLQIANETAATLSKVVDAAKGTETVVDKITGAAREQLSGQAQMLKDLVGQFRLRGLEEHAR